eukprot:scaffold41044_cov68-Phaeocystis_antarctica.AAC.4
MKLLPPCPAACTSMPPRKYSFAPPRRLLWLWGERIRRLWRPVLEAVVGRPVARTASLLGRASRQATRQEAGALPKGHF